MLQTEIQAVKGIGAARAALFNKLGIQTVEDLLSYLPKDYRDLTQIVPVAQMRTGAPYFGFLTLREDAKLSYVRRNMNIVRVRAGDETGTVALVFYNQPYQKNALKAGKRFYAYGIPAHSGGEIRLSNPMMESEESSEGSRLLPVYRTTRGLSQSAVRKSVRGCLSQFGDAVGDVLPRELREKHGLLSLRDAYELAHFPVNVQALEKAVGSLAFTELLLLRLYLGGRRRARGKALPLDLTPEQARAFSDALAFSLTAAQLRAMARIEADMGKEEPMSLLLQGDVGSGKTAVAFYALYIAAKNGKQAAMMAPTELLALQHHRSAQAVFGPLGIRTACLRSGMKAAERRQVLDELTHKRVDIVFGTHALISADVAFATPGVIVVDEQHRFGVRQRAQLMNKAGGTHALFLSATPIPRTLSLIVYGDLDLAVIDEMPVGRIPVKTYIVPQHKQTDMLAFLAKRIDAGQQGYMICPQIENEEEELLSANALYDRLKGDVRLRCALMHGRLRPAERNTVMERFVSGEIGTLISTTVVEVGVDVPNATVMIVHNAERFGLAQLHQLRGRVGRGNDQSYCFLCTEDRENQRLQALCTTTDGFEIAKSDLEQRGPGVFLGEEQHGRTDVQVSVMMRDARLLERVMEAFDWLQANGTIHLPALMAEAQKRYERPLEDIALN